MSRFTERFAEEERRRNEGAVRPDRWGSLVVDVVDADGSLVSSGVVVWKRMEGQAVVFVGGDGARYVPYRRGADSVLGVVTPA